MVAHYIRDTTTRLDLYSGDFKSEFGKEVGLQIVLILFRVWNLEPQPFEIKTKTSRFWLVWFSNGQVIAIDRPIEIQFGHQSPNEPCFQKPNVDVTWVCSRYRIRFSVHKMHYAFILPKSGIA